MSSASLTFPILCGTSPAAAKAGLAALAPATAADKRLLVGLLVEGLVGPPCEEFENLLPGGTALELAPYIEEWFGIGRAAAGAFDGPALDPDPKKANAPEPFGSSSGPNTPTSVGGVATETVSPEEPDCS
jgi:hypothetical protein